MNDWNDARFLDMISYDLVLGDYTRALNRSRIASAANGDPPFTTEEAQENNIEINVNDLSLTRLLHDSRSQFANGMLVSGNYFTAKTDMGVKHKQSEYSSIVQKEANRLLKGSIEYYESLRAKLGNLVLHGIAPSVWEHSEMVIPRPLGVEDVLIPSGTLLGFTNLPFIFIRRSFTAHELRRLTNRVCRDKGWNMPLVTRCLEWMESEMTQLTGSNWPESWSPEKWQEMSKEGGGLSYSDRLPTLDCFDIYAYQEANNDEKSGWVRRIILDSWSNPTMAGGQVRVDRRDDMRDKEGKSLSDSDKDSFLFSSLDKTVCSSWENIISFQFADLSAVFPARYHSVRSLGWMLYAPTHLRNRMYNKFNESVFEALMQYFKVKNSDDVQRALKINLYNQGFIDETMTPVPAAERWQVNSNLVELGLQENQKVIDNNSKAFTNGMTQQQAHTEKTKFQVMAEVQQSNALVSAALNQAYQYQVFEYREIFRRLLLPNSSDPMSREFRANCLRQGVPEEVLVPEAWDIQSERMVGGGNKTLAMLQVEQLMQWRPMMDPEPQRSVLRDAIATITDDPAKANALVPEQPSKGTPSMHDAELAAGALLSGIQVEPQTGINHIEYIESMLNILGQRVAMVLKSGGVPSNPKELMGLQSIANNVAQHIKILSSDPTEKQRVKKYGDLLGKLVNEIKGFQQRLTEAMKKKQAQGAQGGGDPKEKAKAVSSILAAQSKARLAEKSHAQKSAHKQMAFEQSLKQDQARLQAEIAATDLRTAAQLRQGQVSALNGQ